MGAHYLSPTAYQLLQLPAELTVEGLLKDFYFTCLETSTEDTK